MPPQILVGVGLALVLSALTETALGGRAPQAIHGGWTISARHAGVVIGLLALTPIFTHDIAQQRHDAIDAGTAVILDSQVSPLLKLDLAQRIERAAGRREGQSADDRPRLRTAADDPGDRAEVVSCATNCRTSSTAAPPTPSAPRSASRALLGLLALIPIGSGAEGGAVSGEARARRLRCRRRDRRSRWSSSAPTSPPAAPPTRRRRPRTPASTRPWRNPEGLQRNRRAVHALGARRRRLQARASRREALAQALATPEARERFTERYGISDAKLARAIRAGLLRAVDDAEEAGALSPLLAGPLRETVAASRSTRRSN